MRLAAPDILKSPTPAAASMSCCYAARFSAKSRLIVQGREDSAFLLGSAKVVSQHTTLNLLRALSWTKLLSARITRIRAVLRCAQAPLDRLDNADSKNKSNQIAAHQRDSWQHLRPSVMAPFDTSPGAAPREILVQRYLLPYHS